MPKKKTTMTIAGIVYTLLFAGAGAGLIDRDSDTKCGGVERWEVKVLTDDKAGDVKLNRRTTTIEDMNDISTADYEIKKSTERQDIEQQVYTIKGCFISSAILESDNDIHLVIEDGAKHSMVAEIPDTKCKDAKSSEFIEEFRKARKTFLKYQHVYNQYRFDITGVLFIDKKHAKNPTGNHPNNVELHPVLDLKAVKIKN